MRPLLICKNLYGYHQLMMKFAHGRFLKQKKNVWKVGDLCIGSLLINQLFSKIVSVRLTKIMGQLPKKKLPKFKCNDISGSKFRTR